MSKSPQGKSAQNTDVKKLIEKAESIAAVAVEVLYYQQALFESIAKQNGEHTTAYQLANIGVLLADTQITTFEAELAALRGVML
ncbi:MAG: hypothetical protein R8L58_02720 [Mariprofundaceae bacterium]